MTPNIRCNLDATDLRPLFIFDDVKDVRANGISSDDNISGKAAIRLQRVENARFSDINIKGTPKYFFELRGQGNTEIHLSDTDPSAVFSESACSVVPQTSFIIR